MENTIRLTNPVASVHRRRDLRTDSAELGIVGSEISLLAGSQLGQRDWLGLFRSHLRTF